MYLGWPKPCVCVHALFFPRGGMKPCSMMFCMQDCVVYLCGTKYDLVEENKKLRKVEFHTVKDYTDGKRSDSD